MLIHLDNSKKYITFAAKIKKGDINMYGITDFKFDNNGINWYRLKLSETPYTRRQLLSSLPIFNKFMEIWDCSIDVLCYLLNDLGITDNHLFEYTICKNDFLVANNGVYKDKVVKEGYRSRLVTTHYDVYITANQFASLALNKVAKRVVEGKYPMFLEAPFLKREKRFKDNIEELPMTPDAYLGDIDSVVVFDNDISIGDLIKLYTDKNYKYSYIDKPIWAVYSESHYIYFTIDKSKGGHTLAITFEQLQNGDWESVENHHVQSICLYDNNGEQIKGKWFEGKQKDAPYFNSPIVEAVKKIVLANKK